MVRDPTTIGVQTGTDPASSSVEEEATATDLGSDTSKKEDEPAQDTISADFIGESEETDEQMNFDSTQMKLAIEMAQTMRVDFFVLFILLLFRLTFVFIGTRPDLH